MQRKKRAKVVFKKFLKDNEKILKELERRSLKAEQYVREPWMMRSNPPIEQYEEFLRKETESF